MSAVAERKEAGGPTGASAAAVEKVLLKGDLGALTEAERLAYYKAICESLEINHLTQPFEYIILSGKLRLYARKDCTDQLRKRDGITIFKMERGLEEGIYVVRAYARTKDGREDVSSGAVSLEGLKGDARANGVMRAETKAKRRVTLSICGLGFLDETEAEEVGHAPPTAATPAEPGVTRPQLAKLHILYKQLGYTKADLERDTGRTSSKDLTVGVASSLIEKLEAEAAERERETLEEREAVAAEGAAGAE